jgi:hypothetical protein
MSTGKEINFSDALMMIKQSYNMQNEYYLNIIESLKNEIKEKEFLIEQIKQKLNLIIKENEELKGKLKVLNQDIKKLNLNNNNQKTNIPILYEKPKILNGNKSCSNLRKLNISAALIDSDRLNQKEKINKYNLEPLKTFNYQKILQKIESNANKINLSKIKKNLSNVYDYDNYYNTDFLNNCKNIMKQKDYNNIKENLNSMNSFIISKNECYQKISNIVKQNNLSNLKKFDDFFSSLSPNKNLY